MGLSTSGSGGQSSSTSETSLSKKQASILATHEKQYQANFFPEIVSDLEDVNKELANPTESANNSVYMQGQAKTINNSSAQANNAFSNDMNQRELTGSGTEAQGMIALSSAKTSALSDAYYNSLSATKNENETKKMNLLQMGMGMSPTPTTAAPLGSSAKTNGVSNSLLGLWS